MIKITKTVEQTFVAVSVRDCVKLVPFMNSLLTYVKEVKEWESNHEGGTKNKWSRPTIKFGSTELTLSIQEVESVFNILKDAGFVSTLED